MNQHKPGSIYEEYVNMRSKAISEGPDWLDGDHYVPIVPQGPITVRPSQEDVPQLEPKPKPYHWWTVPYLKYYGLPIYYPNAFPWYAVP